MNLYYSLQINSLIQQGCIKMQQKFSVSTNCCSFELFLFLNISSKKLIIIKFSSTTVFDIDNNKKCLLSTKSAYYKDFRRTETEDTLSLFLLFV